MFLKLWRLTSRLHTRCTKS